MLGLCPPSIRTGEASRGGGALQVLEVEARPAKRPCQRVHEAKVSGIKGLLERLGCEHLAAASESYQRTKRIRYDRRHRPWLTRLTTLESKAREFTRVLREWRGVGGGPVGQAEEEDEHDNYDDYDDYEYDEKEEDGDDDFVDNEIEPEYDDSPLPSITINKLCPIPPRTISPSSPSRRSIPTPSRDGRRIQC